MFSQRSLVLASEGTKINYVIGLLRRRTLAWVQDSSSRTRLSSILFDKFVGHFQRIFDRPNHSGSTSDRLLTLHLRGIRSGVLDAGSGFWVE